MFLYAASPNHGESAPFCYIGNNKGLKNSKNGIKSADL